MCYLTMLALAEHLTVALWHHEHANIAALGVRIRTTGPSLWMAAGRGRAASAAAEERSPMSEPWPAELIV